MAAILGPFFICPFYVFSGFLALERDVQPWIQWLFKTSFLKYSIEGSLLAIFGYDRNKLECNEIYCHYTRPKTILQELDVGSNASYSRSLIALILMLIGLRLLAYFIMSMRLRLCK